jgi:UDP-N-acetylmuramoyl-tripeptide--D-alanyl-D-alanine ligase
MGMDFTAKINGQKKLELHTDLIGRHLLGPLSVAIAVAHELGLTNQEIKAGVAATRPYEHRMQPRSVGGAWILDDSYNGSIEGFRAGLELLKELEAKRKIYVTPGLVDQGEETARVHQEIGKLIADCSPDKVVLMQNSVTAFIENGLRSAGYNGRVEIRDDPLEFYSNIDQTIAAGDIILMQNDWTDNYS